MNNIREHIYLSAILHEIGKFYQKADTENITITSSPINIGELEDLFYLKQEAKYTLWTKLFIKENQQVFNKLLKNTQNESSNKDNLKSLVKSQINKIEQIIKEALLLSSGKEDYTEELSTESESNWKSCKNERLIPILETIGNQYELLTNKEWHQLPVQKLIPSIDNFPQQEITEVPNYSNLWKEFKSEFASLTHSTYQTFSGNLLTLLYKYTSFIPSNITHSPDISLYDHIKTTTALAICLYDLMCSGEKPKDRFLLIGADLSGIQSYIYQIVSKHAGKNLKGRSFYIRVLSDAVVRYLMKRLGLFQANIIYNSGGGFYLLAPNTTDIKHKLKTAIEEIEKRIFTTHGTSLYVAIDSITVSDDALLHRNGEDIGKLWGDLFIKRDRRKNQRYTTMMEEDYKRFFTPQSGLNKFDCISGEEIPANEQSYSEGDLSPLRYITKEQIILGHKLRDFDLLIISESEVPYLADKCSVEPAQLGFHYYLLKQEELIKVKDKICFEKEPLTILQANTNKDGDNLVKIIENSNTVYGLFYYGGNELGCTRIPTFEELCHKSDTDNAFKRLGVLRMDVDNLGRIFQAGINPQYTSLSRYATLSRSLDYFFSGYLNEIWRETDPSKSIIIYSGGDDLFIVGSWEKTVEIAKRIREDFRKYTCNNPNLTISGGVALLSPKFPIMKGAEESAIEEDRAKKHQCMELEKNSFALLNTALNWDEEFPAVEALKNEIKELHIDDAIKSSFISKVLRHRTNAEIDSHKITNFKTYWMIAYDMDRMKNRTKDVQAKELINQYIKEICGNSSCLNNKTIKSYYHPLELWALACRWAELELRTNK